MHSRRTWWACQATHAQTGKTSSSDVCSDESIQKRTWRWEASKAGAANSQVEDDVEGLVKWRHGLGKLLLAIRPLHMHSTITALQSHVIT